MLDLLPPALRPVTAAPVASARQGLRWGLGHALPKTMVAGAARRGDLQGELIVTSRGGGDPQTVFDVIERIRAEGPVYGGSIGYVTTSHRLVKEVLSSNDFRTGFPADNGLVGRTARWAEDSNLLGPLVPPSLLVTEPPDHTRYRKLVTRVFSVKAVRGLRDRAQELADQLLDELDPSRPQEMVAAYCSLLPVTMIAEILGVPVGERGRVQDFGNGAAPSLDLGLSWGQFRQVERSLREFDRWLTGHLEQLRREPGEDLLSQLVAAQDEGQGLSPAELKATAGLVLAAGFETTVNLLGNGIVLLSEHRDQLASLGDDEQRWTNAVDEVLRVDPPVLLTGRMCARDTMVGEQPVRAGSFVSTVLAGANRDPEVFEDPHRFDVARENARDHVAFSAGRHFCLGAALARMEGEVGLRTLFDRYPDLEVLPGARRRPTRILRGYAELPVRLR